MPTKISSAKLLVSDACHPRRPQDNNFSEISKKFHDYNLLSYVPNTYNKPPYIFALCSNAPCVGALLLEAQGLKLIPGVGSLAVAEHSVGPWIRREKNTNALTPVVGPWITHEKKTNTLTRDVGPWIPLEKTTNTLTPGIVP